VTDWSVADDSRKKTAETEKSHNSRRLSLRPRENSLGSQFQHLSQGNHHRRVSTDGEDDVYGDMDVYDRI